MTITITKPITSRFSPNCPISCWVVGQIQVKNLSTDVPVIIAGYYDQAGHDAKGPSMGNMKVVIPAAQAGAALVSDTTLGEYLLSLPQFTGGTLTVS